MKEIEQKVKPLTEKIIAAENRNKKTTFVGSSRIHKGQRIFKLDSKTGVMSALDDSDFKIVLTKGQFGGMVTRKQLHVKGTRYKYIIALNKKNAAKKFRKRGYEIKPVPKASKHSIRSKDKGGDQADIV